MKCASALSTLPESRAALREVVDHAARTLEGEPADLALVFASMHHAEALEEIAALITREGVGQNVLGCTGESIVGEDKEIEGAPALSLWSLHLPGIAVRPRRVSFSAGVFDGWTELEAEPQARPAQAPAPGDRPSPVILLADPFSFPTDPFLKRLTEIMPGTPVLGGMASGSNEPGENRFVLNGEVFADGAVGVELSGPLLLRSIVSQGCRPIGPTMIVTKVERNVIRELGRRPAIDVVREIFANLSEEDQERVQQGLHIGRVINEYQEKFQRGDFLVRNVIGGDDAGGVAITDIVRVGQTVQLHVRDADTADEDLRGLLMHAKQACAATRLAGALLFTCNGRGSRLFSRPHHDVSTIHEILGPIPVAGFFAMGEIGPVGGQNFVHGFTASIALFAES
jgi:small ligand-binding sensory domain FIST